MNPLLLALGIVAAGVVGFTFGKKRREHPDFRLGPPNQTHFVTAPGTDGFVRAVVVKDMKGRNFTWRRLGVKPAPGSRFEIRPKHPDKPSPLIPEIPFGRDEIVADARRDVPDGTRYIYSLWQVLEDGRERELHDPELEIGQI